ncbi:hypothetical protein HO133_006208 [Letharia lupina]|uniref:Small secreted protein n=1 Tax=Letharia lupina TaxID=560253 RepID=A0A8H6C7W5_9LECA|nr:uncharacterized protein HO133_006208 [Letharia lupina]KAF6218246.1 hypothetical protein HO133_006208 [Letharia lupina]
MRLTAVTLANLSAFIVSASTLPKTPPAPSRLNITTIAAANDKSTLECWQLSAPFVQSSQAGTSGAVIAQLGETGATSYSLIPSQFDGGFHNAPVVQYVAFTSGLAIVSLPNSTRTATIPGGRNGLILATDTTNVSTLGHKTVYPSKEVTVGIQIPTRNNEIPLHTVLHAGPCTMGEMDQ